MIDFCFGFDGFPYTRMVAGSWFAAKPSSQIGKYIAWKGKVSDAYEQLDLSDEPDHPLLPFEVPLGLDVHFVVEANWANRDIDNMVKGICDALNPTLALKPPSLVARTYVDDRLIRFYEDVVMQPISSKYPQPEIRLTFRPVFQGKDGDGLHLGIYRFWGYHSAHSPGVTSVKVADTPLYLPTTPMFDPTTITTGGQRYYTLVDRVDGCYLLFPSVHHAFLYLLAKRHGGRVLRRTEELLREASFNMEASESITGKGGFAEKIDAVEGGIKAMLAAHTGPRTKAMMERVAQRLYVEANAMWPACRGTVRDAMIDTPVMGETPEAEEETLYQLALAHGPALRKPKKAKKAKLKK